MFLAVSLVRQQKAVFGLIAALLLNGVVGCANTHSFQFVDATIKQVQSAVESGQLSCSDIVSGYLSRIATFDQSTGLNAVIFTNPEALDRAAELDRKRAARQELGELFCVPVLLKDNFDTADMPTSGGSIALKKSTPPDDAYMVRKLRSADAIIIAKTNMAEWAFSAKQTQSSSYGITTNAYDRSRVPAGSSGGTASGIAASFGVIGMGSDTGNSIRGPASHLSLFGIRSTIGLTSRDGVIPLAFDRDIAGPLTRTVADSARVFNVVAGYDVADPYTLEGKGKRERDYTAFLKPDALMGKRVGVLRALVDTADADPEIVALFESALDDLRRSGATTVDDFQILNLAQHMAASNFCPRFRYDLSNYLKSLGSDAPITDVSQVLASRQYADYIEGRLKFFSAKPATVHPGSWSVPCEDFANHPGRQAFLADVTSSMDAANVDVIVYPSWTNKPAPLRSAIDDYKGDNSQLIAPATGLPAVSVPMGFSGGNLPAGLQILGRAYSEGLLFGVSFAYEQATLHRVPPADYPELQD